MKYFLLTRNIFVLFPDITRSVECLSCLARDWLRSEKSNNSSPSGFRQGGTPGADGQPAQIITSGCWSRRVGEVFQGHASKVASSMYVYSGPRDSGLHLIQRVHSTMKLLFGPKTNLASAKWMLVALMLQRDHSIIVAPIYSFVQRQIWLLQSGCWLHWCFRGATSSSLQFRANSPNLNRFKVKQ